jgi:hypothetical protein
MNNLFDSLFLRYEWVATDFSSVQSTHNRVSCLCLSNDTFDERKYADVRVVQELILHHVNFVLWT